MKQYLLKVFLFLIPIIVLAYPLDLLISRQICKLHKDPAELEVMQDIYSGKMRCDIAIYGSSRAWAHVNPRIIDSATGLSSYNFGIDGHNFWIQYLRHLEFLKHNPKPKIILLVVDIYSLQKRKDLNEPIQFMPYALWNKNIREYTRSFDYFRSIDYYVPLARYAGKVSALTTAFENIQVPEDSPRYRYKGFRGHHLAWTDAFSQAKLKMDHYEIRYDSASIALFNQFINECRQDKIQLVLVYPPRIHRRTKFYFQPTIAYRYDAVLFEVKTDSVLGLFERFT